MVPASEPMIAAFAADVALCRLAVAASRSSAALLDGDAPVALLGVSRDGRAWMHSVPAFRAPLEAFRLMRRQFRAWAADGEVRCEMDATKGRPVRVMGLIQKTTIHDGIARFVLKDNRDVH